jgi:hypothetical protein
MPNPTQHHKGVLVGYARTSTAEQDAGLQAQVRDLQAAGCTKIFQEQVSSIAERAELERALDYVRGGDTLVVTKVDRLARSTVGLWEIVKRLEAVEEWRGRASGAQPRRRDGRHQERDGFGDPLALPLKHHLAFELCEAGEDGENELPRRARAGT